METDSNSKIQTLEPQDTGLIKQQGWELTQIFCLEFGMGDETYHQALEFANKLSVQFNVALHTIYDSEFYIVEVYRK